jgi:hypothetical protein
MYYLNHTPSHEPWNKGKLIGQRPPLKLREIWVVRIRLKILNNIRGLDLFNLAIDSKLRSCDLVKLKVRDVSTSGSTAKRAMVVCHFYSGRKLFYAAANISANYRANWLNIDL